MKISLWPRSSADILNKTTVGAFVFIFVALTGLAVCIDYGLFFRYWLAFLSGILLYVCLLYDIESMDQVEGIVFTCIISGFVWSAVGLSLFFIENSSFIKGNVNTMYRVGSLSGDSNYFASVLICLIQLSFFWLIRKGGKGKLFSLVAFFTMGLALVFTYSRGGYIGIGALLFLNLIFLWMYRYKLSSQAYLGKALSLLSMLVAVILVLAVTVNTFSDRVVSIKEDKTGGSSRLFIWEDLLDVAQKNPFGVGLGNVSVYTAEHRSEYHTAGSVAHNNFLQILVETGYVGFLSYLFFLWSYFSKFIYLHRIKDREIFFWFLGTFISIVGVFVTQYFLSNVYDEMVFIQIALLLAIFNIYEKSIKTQTEEFSTIRDGRGDQLVQTLVLSGKL